MELKRASLGRVGFIGELYDARRESFSSVSLFQGQTPKTFFQSTDMNHMEYEYTFIENSSDRFDLFSVQGELHVAVLLGLVDVDGSAKFLTDEMKSKDVISSSLLCKILTVNEKLIASFYDILPFVDLNALNDPQFTHVIVEINWGANCLLSLESSCNSQSNKEEIKGCLAGELSALKKCLSVKAGGDLKREEKDSKKNKNFKVRVRADVLPLNGLPMTVDGFHRFVEDVPNLLKNVNEGKGKPLSFVMIPLSGIRSRARLQSAVEATVIKIEESFLTSLLLFFEDVAQLKGKFNDLLALINANKNLVPVKAVKEAREKQKEFLVKESDLKCSIREEWVSVRSGKKALKDLIRIFEQFKSRNFNLFSYEDFLDSYSFIPKKLTLVQVYKSLGVLYLGEGDKFNAVQLDHPSSEFIVMVTSTQMEKADPELCRKTTAYFLTLAEERLENTVYVVIDFDYDHSDFFTPNPDRVTCLHLKGSRVLCSDVLAAYLADTESNFARLKKLGTVEICKHKPGNRVTLKMPCPGFGSTGCSTDELEWKCSACKSNLEYGFDENFYCSCGKAAADSFEYLCSNPKHGDAFFPAPSNHLKKVLSALRPLKEMNLLVIGQSGVGKSTWINSIINYLTYDTLGVAKEFGPIIAIPSKLTVYDPETSEKREIMLGEENSNEVTSTGDSATQYARTYSFLWEDRCVRIIDTPGIGDTRGLEQDRENITNMVDHLSHLKELHGVCILLKANENRMTALFRYCLKELLVHLHKSVVKNVLFCFTNARNSFYSPGSASTLLENLLHGLAIKELALGGHNRFCLDNEAFLFLCALENGMKFKETLERSFQESWELSLNETRRLFKTIKDFQPHVLKETVSLVKARMRVLTLTKPLAEVSKTIQINLNTLSRKKADLTQKDLTVEELTKKLNITEVQLEAVPLKQPRTVCTSAKCVSYLSYQGIDIKEIEYKTHCHVACYLKNVTPKLVNNPDLKGCEAMGGTDFCTVCGCPWENHMHITYSQRRVEKTVVDKNVKTHLEKELTEKEKIEEFMQEMEEKIKKYKEEETFILQATAKFGMFLKQNAISVYNDALEEYLLLLIKTEEEKPHKTEEERELLEKLQDSLRRYRAEVEVLTNAINSGDQGIAEEMTPERVNEIEEKLYKLELMGKAIKELVKLSRSSHQRAQEYNEQPIQLGKNRTKIQSGWGNFKNSVSSNFKNLKRQFWKKNY